MRVPLLSLLLVIIGSIGYGQSSGSQTYTNYEQTILPPSPNAASLARYIDYPVSLSTGVPDINIPLYTLTSKKLSVPISISYHAGGIKVSDHEGTVGAGWTLNAGGCISRAVKDIPDESQYGYFNMVYPDENGSATSAQKDYCLSNHIYDIYTADHIKYDGEPDLFYYTFGNLNGSFMFRNRIASGIDPKVVTIPYSPIKISGNFQTFQTKDLEGNTYTFGDVANARASTLAGSGLMRDYGNILNAWYLTKIVSVDKTDSIAFVYDLFNSNTSSSLTTATGLLNYPQIGPATATTAIVYINGISSDLVQIVSLKEIVGKNGKVGFTHDPYGKLTKIDIFTGSNSAYKEIKAYQLYQSLFTNCNRTRLDSIQETGYLNNAPVQNTPPHKFTYYSQDAPPIDSKDQDFWGFYNYSGISNTDMLYVKSSSTGSGTNTTFVPAPEKRTPNEEATKKGVLQQITYPTGGYTNFIFEENKIDTTITNYQSIPQAITHTIRTFNLQPNDQITGVNVTFTPSAKQLGQVKLYINGNYTCSPSSSCATNIPEVILYDVTQNTKVDDILLTDLYHNTVTSQVSTTYYTLNKQDQYKLYFPTPGRISSYGEPTQYRVDATLTETLPDSSGNPQTVSQTVLAGGLRVKQITNNDGKGNTVTKRYNYTRPYFNNPILFSGSYNYIINNLTREKYNYTNGLSQGTASSQQGPGVWVKTSNTYTEGINIPVGGTSGSALSYAQVEETLLNGNSTPLGKTVYTYNKTTDYLSNQYPMFRVGRDFLRCQLIDTKTYKIDNMGNYMLVKETTNNYNNVNDYRADDPGRDSIKFYKTYINFDYQYVLSQNNEDRIPNAYSNPDGTATSLGCPVYPNFYSGLQLHISPFYYHVIRPLLSSTVTTDYDLNGQQPVTSKTDYAYDNYNHMLPTRITAIKSNQKLGVQTIKYPLDYSYQGNCNLQGCIVNFNQQLANLKAQRDQCEQAAFSSNADNTTAHTNALAAYDACQTNYNNAVQQLVNQYNACYSQYQQCYAGNESTLSAADKAIAYMQDKNMVTPKVDMITTVNGNQTERVKTNYLITDNAGNSIRPQQVNVQVAGNNIEARVSFAYNNGDLVQQQLNNGPSTSYLWGYNSQYPVAEVKNASYQDVVSVLGQNVIDQLAGASPGTDDQVRALLAPLRTDSRLKNAQVTIYTYEPLVGMTSATDKKGMTTTYEYDSFQRLLNVKDQNGNIARHNDYHYQNQ